MKDKNAILRTYKKDFSFFALIISLFMYFCKMEEKKKLKIIAPSHGFVLPYIKRELPQYEIVIEGDADECTVIISPDGTIPADAPNNATVLLCPNVVGTGMTGLPMELATSIAGGTYFHIEGVDTHLSTIHASDVAKAVRLSLGKGGHHKVTDGADPSFHDFAEALAYRLKNKRIMTLKPILAKFLVSKKLKTLTSTDRTIDGSAFAEAFGFHPVPVTEYLRTHVYDDESL